VALYVKGLQDWQSGGHEWHIRSSRYMNEGAADEALPPIMGGLASPISALASFPAMKPGAASGVLDQTPTTTGLSRLEANSHAPFEDIGEVQLPDLYMPYDCRVNPHLEQTRVDCLDWCEEMGFYLSVPGMPGSYIWTRAMNDGFDFGQCSARLNPDATAEALNLSTRWLAWGTYGDDLFPRVYGAAKDFLGAKLQDARLAYFMPLDCASMPVPLNPLERGLADVWLDTATPMSIEHRSWLKAGIEAMTAAWVWELQNMFQHRIPDPVDYVEMRRGTFGADLTMSFARIRFSGKLPAELLATRPMMALQNASQDYSCWSNDVFSVQKELQFEGELHNMVLVVRRFLGITTEQAMKIVGDLMNSRMRQFEDIIAAELPYVAEQFELDDDGRAALDEWVVMMQDWMAGILVWHHMTARYPEASLRRLPAIGAILRGGRPGEGDTKLDARPAPFASSPTGLGTSAARLAERVRAAAETATVG